MQAVQKHFEGGPKTERITILATPGYKSYLQAEARKQGVSLSQFIQARLEAGPSQDETLLAELTAQARDAISASSAKLDRTIERVEALLNDMQISRDAS